MNAQEAETAYRSIKCQFDAGLILLDEFNRRVAELRYQDKSGTWWAISPIDGSWLRWNGSRWVPAFAQQAPVVQAAPAQAAPQSVSQPATPSWYIPPVSSGQPQKTVESTPEATGLTPAVKQLSKTERKLAAGSIACGVLAFIVIPYVMGIIGVILGALSLKEKYKMGAIGIVLSVGAMALNYL